MKGSGDEDAAAATDECHRRGFAGNKPLATCFVLHRLSVDKELVRILDVS